ncbi:MAG: FlgT C-terminal domain-containing protein [Kiritimatiellales bacterium]
MTRAICSAGLILGLLSGCLSIQNRSSTGLYELSHHNWWNYYQRGRLYLKDGKFDEARKDFETAMGRIPGARYPYAQERWRARTYGMHMLEGYFPHRELGICLFELNQPEDALKLLETSIQMEPSARAKFYINRIHQQLAAAAVPPWIELTNLPGWTDQRTLLLQGAASGTNAVAALTVNGEAEFIELASTRIRFRHEIPLKEGRNLIYVNAEDVAGRQTVTNLVVMADWTPPQIHLQRTGSFLSITCSDNLDLQHVQINDRTLSPSGNEYTLSCPLNANEPLRLGASDCAGNRTEWILSKNELQHLAQNQTAAPPRLHVADSGKTITLCKPEYALDIRAEDDTALRAVKLNGENLLTKTTPLFRTLQRVPLSIGINKLTLAAEDSEGNRTEEQITVIYRQPEYLDRMYRLAASLAPLAGEIPDPSFEQRLDDLIGHELTLDPVRFYLLADEEDARQLRKEQNLSNSELADPRALLRQDRRMKADLTFVTRVLSDGSGQTVYTQVFDADSGQELFIEDVYLEDPRLLPRQVGGLIMKIEQHFPLIQDVVQQQNKQLFITAGEKNGAQKGARFLVVRSAGAFEQGRVLLAGNRPAELIISEVESETAQVILPGKQTEPPVQAGDYVFSR